MIPQFAGKYVGLPWSPLGRGPDSFDCWGLCVHVAKEEFGWDWDSYMETYTGHQMANAEDALAVAMVDGHWERIDKSKDDSLLERSRHVQAGDVVHILHASSLVHVGFMLDTNSFLHLAVGMDSVIDRLDSPIYKTRIEGLYRWTP